MIDQLPTAVPQTAQSVNTAGRDRKQTSADKGDKADTFEDVVSKTGPKQQSRQDKDAEIDLRPQEDVKERPVDARPKVALDLSAALRGFAVPAQAQIQGQIQSQKPGQMPDQMQGQPQGQLQNHLQNQIQSKIAAKDMTKVADRADQAGLTHGRQADVALERLVEKLKHATQQAEQLAQRSHQVPNDVVVDAKQPLTASDELGLLLGLTKETEAKPGKKTADTEKTEKKSDDERDSPTDMLVAKTDMPRAEHAAATVDARFANDAPASDGKSQGDVVRLVSANGRGRPVEVEVTPVVGETQRETPKTSNAPKFETATVLEARRYLGFTPEPNTTALATAIKADPTWTEALQATERSGLGTLGNTVTEVNTLKLQMSPENLGSMVASLKLKGEELTVELRVDSIEAYQQLSADHDDIVKGLQDQGFSIDKVTVQLNATDRTDTGADRDTARQGQAQRDGQAEQREARDGQRGRSDERQDGRQRWTAPVPVHDDAAGNGRGDAARPGNIYL